MASHSIHHVYVIDDEDKPAAVVTPTDVLRLFVVDDRDSLWNVVWAQPQCGPGAGGVGGVGGVRGRKEEADAMEPEAPAYDGAEGVVV